MFTKNINIFFLFPFLIGIIHLSIHSLIFLIGICIIEQLLISRMSIHIKSKEFHFAKGIFIDKGVLFNDQTLRIILMCMPLE